MNPTNIFEVTQQETESGTIVFLQGQLDLSMAPYFRTVLEPLVIQKDKTLTLNLRDLRYIDSTGIGIIISFLKMRNEMGTTLNVEEVSPKTQRLFDMIGITKFLMPQKESRMDKTGGTA
ncbi:STAS domain-containing protein [Brevibacillus laterosporus]|uniref:Anti-sigma factor antagonist n=2 Tax=Brevibacillus TaxID=55080 RepID=A0A0F7EG63_BRELA|nr:MULTISPECIES: STAS domain-containing protein [Brevibacillus]AKF93673.1 anti-sigma F factor antagonist [Brevibacillus laterosporus]MBA4534350.1 STAS domain-containing protein [Brevibacillus halotolerans]MCR8987406.1 STAS domain-containing protein [Brevibacillus laterosporus]MCZ0833144.1 STAS domain-containing protein [Brevibacillus halotolerans]OAJ72831.1 anti-sigma F factor antagonist [Brevibacillus sp. SKDU10]